MAKFNLQIKEKGHDSILTPSYEGDVDRAFVEDFFGVHNPDVEWYKIDQVK
jgi:hypothetical protein